MRVAVTREVSPAMARCELTHLARVPIDVGVARMQHALYEQCLVESGCTVRRLEAGPDMPDAVFIEDVAIVLDDVAIITRPGAESRRPETAAVADVLSEYRLLRYIEGPGTLDGGDVLVAGRTVFVGCSSRTTAAAIDELRDMLRPHAYAVQGVRVTGCLHLKSAVTAIADDVLLINRAWVPVDPFSAFGLVDVDPGEPFGANALRIGTVLIYPAACPRTGERLQKGGFRVRSVDVSEIAKAEGAVTCCSLVFHAS